MRPPVLISCLTLALLISGRLAADGPTLIEKYRHGLLTPNYGIVTEEDLAIDAWKVRPVPYDPWHEFFGYNRWQCFPLDSVKPQVRTWRGRSAMDASHLVFTMCSLKIWVEHEGEIQIYSETRNNKVEHCNQFMKNWNQLTRDEPIVCLNGDGGGWHTHLFDGVATKAKGWVWDKIKTRKGCHSYFAGECEFSYWKSAGFPGIPLTATDASPGEL